MDKQYWWEKALEASQQIGWFPTVILAQWQWETGNFTSSNLRNNNNIAGQTWTKQYPESMKGTARPSNEGGYYVKYDSPVDGYVDFIKRNSRYKNVNNKSTEEKQIREIASQGWAADKNYANGLINVLNYNKKQGYTLEVANEIMKQIEELQSKVYELETKYETLLNTAQAHIELIGNLEQLNNMDTIPYWAVDAINKAVEKGLVDTNSGSYDFYRIMTILHRKGVI